MTTVGIVGSRNFNDYDLFLTKINQWILINGPIIKIVSGGAFGVDSLAAQYANNNNIELLIFPADWKQFGKAAGPIRNQQIVNASEKIIAFPSNESIGTENTIKIATKKGISVTRYDI